MSDDRRLALPIKLLPATIARIDDQCDRLVIGRWKAIEMMIDHGLEWFESLPDGLGPHS